MRTKNNKSRLILFKWDNNLIKKKRWAILSSASKAIFPVIAVHKDKRGECWPSQQKIAALSGCTEKTVREGIKGLEEVRFSGIKIIKSKKYGMRWPGNHYSLDFPRVGKRGYFPFHKSLIESTKWSQLKPSAKALYPVMRCFGYNDSYGRNYRPHDYCDRKKGYLAEFAGINRKSIPTALESLLTVGLIKPVERHAAWKVFID
jgi:hypothetical protein